MLPTKKKGTVSRGNMRQTVFFCLLLNNRSQALHGLAAPHETLNWTNDKSRRQPFHSLILLLIFGTAKPLIEQGREVVSKLLIFGTPANWTDRFGVMAVIL